MCSASRKCRAIAMVLCAALVAACGTTLEPTAVESKLYLEPPKQAKIPASTTSLRVCADPNNLPFSNSKLEGFENRIAEVIAAELKRPVEYTWWAQRRGFFRNTLRAGVCDVVMGVPSSFELAATTQPYYRSTYVFVTRPESASVESLEDPALKTIPIGVQLVGDDGTNTPPAHGLANRGIVSNVKGYTLYGDYSEDNPPARIIDALVRKEIDVAIVWGPLAAFLAGKQGNELTIRPVRPEIDVPYLPFVYDISIGVRRGEDELKSEIEAAMRTRKADIDRILAEYRVPRSDSGSQNRSAAREVKR